MPFFGFAMGVHLVQFYSDGTAVMDTGVLRAHAHVLMTSEDAEALTRAMEALFAADVMSRVMGRPFLARAADHLRISLPDIQTGLRRLSDTNRVPPATRLRAAYVLASLAGRDLRSLEEQLLRHGPPPLVPPGARCAACGNSARRGVLLHGARCMPPRVPCTVWEVIYM